MNNDKKEYEVKSEEVLSILEKYREILNLKRFYFGFEEDFNKHYLLRVIFECDFRRYKYKDIRDGELSIDFSKEKNIVKFGNWVSGSGLVFKSLDKLKKLINMAEELQQIDYVNLKEFREYVAMKDKKKELEEQKAKLEEELLKQKEEIEKKLNELENN